MAHNKHSNGNEMHGSINYVWSTSSYLGRGATAVVYKGVHKVTGEPAAIKTFTTDGFHRPLEAQMKELEILQKLDHENVVKLLAIEEEVQTRNKVVVMELCTGGSLYHILDDPENAYGLEETEFLLVLEHLTAGMKYLRGNIISHRDLKPGNIVKYVKEDGSHVYKLTDFGAARTLEDDEQFTSLCGTEEYLNPDIYDKAVMKLPETKTFKSNVDLWSMGATIYHVATGSLPFRPYRGRDNRSGMHFMIRNKAPGVISAVQHENGDIEWNKELPKTCHLSQGLKVLITPLIASLLESRQDRVWSFNKFFAEVETLLSCQPFHLYDIQHCKEVTHYIAPSKTLLDLQQELCVYTGVPIPDQFLIFSNILLSDQKSILSSLQKTTTLHRILVLNRSSTEIGMQEEITVPKKFPVFDFNTISLDHDAFKAKNFTNLSYVVKRNIEKLVRCHHFILQVPSAIMAVVEEDIRKLCFIVNQTLETANGLDNLLKVIANHCINIQKLLNVLRVQTKEVRNLNTLIEEKEQERDSFRQVLGVLHKRSTSVESKYLRDKELQKQWEQRSGSGNVLIRCNEMALSYIQDIRDSWKQLGKYREMRRLTFHDEQFHQLEKTKIKKGGEKLLLLSQRCNATVHQAVRDLDCWYSGAHVALVQSECLAAELKQGMEATNTYDISLKNAQNESTAIITGIMDQLDSAQNSLELKEEDHTLQNSSLEASSKIISENKQSNCSTILKELQELKVSQSDLWNIIQENNAVIDKFQMLSSNLNTITNSEDAGN